MIDPPLTCADAALLGEVDDDIYGLWEIGGSFKGDPYPMLDDDELIALVGRAVGRGHITVFVGPQFGGQIEALPGDVAIAAVQDRQHWKHREPPEAVFSIMTTKEGNEALQRWVDQNGLPRLV